MDKAAEAFYQAVQAEEAYRELELKAVHDYRATHDDGLTMREVYKLVQTQPEVKAAFDKFKDAEKLASQLAVAQNAT